MLMTLNTFYIVNLHTSINMSEKSERVHIMYLLSNTIASVGIIANLTVVIAFLNHRKLRRKIPNIFIMNQVNSFLLCVYEVKGSLESS